ncbi:MAG: heme-binding protein [Myxococcota bacterium]
MAFPSRRSVIIGGLGSAVVATSAVVGTRAYAADIEKPAYEVVARHPGFEVRRYAPRLVAEVEVQGRGKDAANAGFRVLANFIFGDNVRRTEIAMTAPVDRQALSEEIAMTAPVDRTQAGKERWVIAFTMPSKYTAETLPRPNDERVMIREIPRSHFAAVRFSGSPGEKSVQRRMQALEDAVETAGLTSAGRPPVYSRYDPPWTLPFLRRNEIQLELVMDEPSSSP